MRIAVVGAGAMGCVLGGHLFESDHDVTLIDVWADHVRTINEKGLHLTGVSGDRVLHPRAVTSPVGLPVQDLVLIMVKSTYTEQAAKDALSIIGPGTMVLTVQNGVGNADKIAAVVGPEKVIAGTTANGAVLLGPGEIKHAGKGETVIGEYSGKLTERVQKLAEVLDAAGLEAKAVENVQSIIWSKLLMNASSNALTAILRVTLGELISWPETRELIKECIGEVTRVTDAKGIRLLYDDPVDTAFKVMKDLSEHYTTMYQDVVAKRRTEIDVINGAVVAEGERLGIPTPVNKVLVNLIKAIERTYDRQA